MYNKFFKVHKYCMLHLLNHKDTEGICMARTRLPATQQYYSVARMYEALAFSKFDSLLKLCVHVIDPILQTDLL